MIRLSICIATLNRARFLAITLDELIGQSTPEVEIVVVDGASTDDTEQVIRDHQRRFSRLVYEKDPRPEGVDRAFCKAIELASGEYCWLMCDDDLIHPLAISKVLAATEDKHALIIVNGEVRSADLSKVLETKRVQVDRDTIFQPGEEESFFATAGGYLTFIGCVVIKRAVWNSRNAQPYLGTEFVHFGIIFQQPLNGTVFLIAEPLVMIRYGLGQWRARSFLVFAFNWPELVWSFARFSDAAKKRLSERDPWRRLVRLLQYRARGSFSLDEYRRFIRPRLSLRRERIVPVIAALIPGLLLNSIGIAYYRATGNRLALVDLEQSPFYWRALFRRK